MNTIQKICVMVAVGSIVGFLISTIFLGFDGTVFIEPHPEKEYYESRNLTVPLAYREGVNVFRIKYLFMQNNDYNFKTVETNWLGIISLINIALSITAFFLFKEK